MGIGVIAFSHVNVTVPAEREAAAIDFYETLVGLSKIPKPVGTRQSVGAWFQLGSTQLHLSTEEGVPNENSDRHVCYQVSDVAIAEIHFRQAGVEIIPDGRPVVGQSRFFVRDPGGNLLEITEKTGGQ